ncbi:phenazine biosynthesis protein PhzF family [Alteromonadaceae bacterium Bs31]|nr:phenazine biosynthesis protein PhzF family [Alteromonadaceae bacterium Bs31]
MELSYYQVDAFAKQPFEGNPAAVILTDTALNEALMQSIAMEFNLSETGFLVPSGSSNYDYALRWFTPAKEINLCGHGTLAAAHVLIHHLGFSQKTIRFNSASGILTTEKLEDGALELDFPANPASPVPASTLVSNALGVEPLATLVGGPRLLAILPSAQQVADLQPNMNMLMELPQQGICVSAPGCGDFSDFDFVSRFFAPRIGIPEDPVTGSAHTALVPYYAEQLGKQQLRAKQLSTRSGILNLELAGDRVKIAGHALTVATGTLYL